MKEIVKIILICFGCIIGTIIIGIAGLILFGKGNLSLPIEKKEVFQIDNKAEYAKPLYVKDNKI